VSIDGKKGKEFSGIDNMEVYGKIHSYIFAPTYGLNNIKNGVIQLYNRNKEVINEEELMSYQKFVGILMQSVIDINKAVDIELNVKRVLDSLLDKAGLYNSEGSNCVTDLEEIQLAMEVLKRIFVVNETSKRRIVDKNPMFFSKIK